jgi:ClpP class serine protease
MRQESFGALLAIINGDNDNDFTGLFHTARKEAFIGDIGERSEGQDLVRIRNNVGILDIDGPIVHRASGVSKISGLTSIEGLGREFQELEANPEIDTIILLMDTPGGVVAGTSEFADMVAKCKKYTAAYIYGAAASAGYWIASAADKIISSDVGAVGSIGVVMTAEIEENEKIKIISSQSKNKQLSLKSKEGKAQAQEVVDDMADVFINTVAENRNTTRENVLKNYGQGKIFVANKALKLGMIDEIGTLKSVLEKHDKESRNEPVMIHGATIESVTIEGKEYKAAPDTEIQTKNREKVQANNGTSVPKIRKEDERKKGKKMTLFELMVEYPEIRQEVETLKSEAIGKAIDSYQAVITEASKFIGGEYQGPVSALAVEVIQGKAHLDSLKATVTAVDQMREDKKSKEAKGESDEIGDIGGLNVTEQTSQDGMLRNGADIEAEAQRLKAVAVLA